MADVPYRSVVDIPDEELLRRVIVHITKRDTTGRRRVPLWSAVMERFVLGSTYATQLCRRFGLDPDMSVCP